MFYYAHFDYADDGITVTFPDIPEAITCAGTEEKAMERAEDVLLSSIEIYFDDDKPFPLAPKKAPSGLKAVYLSDNIYAKVLLHNQLLKSGMSKSQLATAIDTNPPEINRIFNLKRKTQIDTIARALQALGAQLKLSI